VLEVVDFPLQALLNFRERVRHFRRSPKVGCQKMFAESGLAACSPDPARTIIIDAWHFPPQGAAPVSFEARTAPGRREQEA
jgi:hypothetical protein